MLILSRSSSRGPSVRVSMSGETPTQPSRWERNQHTKSRRTEIFVITKNGIDTKIEKKKTKLYRLALSRY